MTDLHTGLAGGVADAVQSAAGYIFDMDGTIALGDRASGGHAALPFAIDLIRRIKARGVPVRVFTNGTAKPPAGYAASLRQAGFDLADEEMMTPSSAAASWFAGQGIGKVRVLGIEGGMAPLRAVGIDVVAPAQEATGVEAVYTGWYREFGFPSLEAACQDIWDGALLTTASHVPFFATASGRAIGSSFAINAMITALTEQPALVLGKPSEIAFEAACNSMGLAAGDRRKVVIVGDDPGLEMRMAHDAQVLGIGMTTGLMTRGTVAGLPPAERPMVLLDTLEPLYQLLS